ncbi:hypothetical protein KJ766_01335 [Patescibacteria group bacterium]|nr:hypothetical protein [Patescibacteria group bacterium]
MRMTIASIEIPVLARLGVPGVEIEIVGAGDLNYVVFVEFVGAESFIRAIPLLTDNEIDFILNTVFETGVAGSYETLMQLIGAYNLPDDYPAFAHFEPCRGGSCPYVSGRVYIPSLGARTEILVSVPQALEMMVLAVSDGLLTDEQAILVLKQMIDTGLGVKPRIDTARAKRPVVCHWLSADA